MDFNLTDPTQNQSVSRFYDGKSVFLTGGTGFIGKVILEKLLMMGLLMMGHPGEASEDGHMGHPGEASDDGHKGHPGEARGSSKRTCCRSF